MTSKNWLDFNDRITMRIQEFLKEFYHYWMGQLYEFC